MKIPPYIEEAVDMAWRTEGLGPVLLKNNEPLYNIFINVQTNVLTDNHKKPRLTDQDYKHAFQVMGLLADKYNFDSGKRRFSKKVNIPPEKAQEFKQIAKDYAEDFKIFTEKCDS